MRRMILALAVMVLFAGLATACPTLGVYHSGRLHFDPEGPFIPFELGLYIVHWDEFVTAVEYQLLTPDDPLHEKLLILNVTYPPNHSIFLGAPYAGHSITFWPPCSGYPDGYDLLATYTCVTTVGCQEMWDYPIKPGPHPDSGFLRGTMTPDNEMFKIGGLTSILCVNEVSVGADSWGAIKNQFKK